MRSGAAEPRGTRLRGGGGGWTPLAALAVLHHPPDPAPPRNGGELPDTSLTAEN